MAGYDVDAVCKKMEECVIASKAGKKEGCHELNSKACARMLKDTKLPSALSGPADIALSASKEKGKGFVDLKKKDQVQNFMGKCGKEYAAVQLKKPVSKVTAEEAKEHECKLAEKIMGAEFKAPEVKMSKTGNVGGLTDHSKYTGAHKERFDESGKGKGAEGRVDKADNSGYVGNYKGEGSYGKK